MSLQIRRSCCGPLLLLLAGCGSQVSGDDEIPAQARRRINQAMWPQNLFDSSGQPEQGFVRRGFQPAYSDLSIRQVAAPEGLSNVVLFVGKARVSGCSHCGVPTVAVARRDSVFISLSEPSDFEYLAAWTSPQALGDSVALRTLLVSLLRITCFVGCDVKPVREKSEVPYEELLSSVEDNGRSWRMPRTYSWQKNGGVLVEFAVHSPGYGVYGVRAEVPAPGRLFVSTSLVARSVF